MFSHRPAVLFDLDGTLIDSGGDLTASLGDVLGQDDLPPLGQKEVLAMLGDGTPVLISRAYARHGREAPADALERFRASYTRRCCETTRPYPGIPELLRRLARGRSVAVATNKPTAFAERIVEGLGLARHVRVVVGPERAGARKPDPEHVLATLELLGHGPEEAVMIGDSDLDVLSGRGAGAATIGVLWGYRERGELEASGADRLAATVPELARLLGV